MERRMARVTHWLLVPRSVSRRNIHGPLVSGATRRNSRPLREEVVWVWQCIGRLVGLGGVVRCGVAASAEEGDADEWRGSSWLVAVVRCFRRSHRILTRFACAAVDAPSARPAARHSTLRPLYTLAKLCLIDCMNISSLTI